MSTPTNLHPSVGAVLTHPAFDRPPVHNERRPGPKKGTLSFAKAVRRRVCGEQDARDALTMQRRQSLTIQPSPLPTAAVRFASPVPWNRCANSDPPATPAKSRDHHEQAVIDAALSILEAGLAKPGEALGHPQRVKDYLRLHLAAREREAFGVMFFNAHMRLIAFEVLFEGTLTQTAVHPREVARRALQLNASSVVLAHNHPSGVVEPSRADLVLTVQLQQALAMVEVRVLDHVIVGGRGVTSFAERGLL